MNLLFFTSSFPYSKNFEDSFIIPELDSLCDGFDKVIIVPLLNSGSCKDLSRYEKIIVDDSFAKNNTSMKKMTPSIIKDITAALFTPLFIKTLLVDKIFLKYSKLRYCLQQTVLSNRIKNWLSIYLRKNNDKYILYTYWFDYETTGCSYFADNNNVVNIVTRAHGNDVFDFRVPARSMYMRGKVLSKINTVYSVSKAGTLYLQSKFPKYSSKIHHSYLGINKCVINYITQPDNRIFNIFSCSFMIPLKRILLLARYIVILAKTYPQTEIIWTHAGGGSYQSLSSKIY